MNQYTVFCRQSNNQGTTWIGSVQAYSMDDAAWMGRETCQRDWDYAYDMDQIAVIGVAEGDVKIIYWEDRDD